MQYSSTSCSSYQWKMKPTPAESKSGYLSPLGNSGVKKSEHEHPESLIHFILINSFLCFWGMKDHVSVNCLPTPPRPTPFEQGGRMKLTVLSGCGLSFWDWRWNFFSGIIYKDPACCSFWHPPLHLWWLSSKESTCNVGDLGSIPELGRSPGEGNGYWWQYPGLENSMDCIVHEVEKNQTRLSDFQFLSPPLRLRDSFLL